jgi:hypothetical protein
MGAILIALDCHVTGVMVKLASLDRGLVRVIYIVTLLVPILPSTTDPTAARMDARATLLVGTT